MRVTDEKLIETGLSGPEYLILQLFSVLRVCSLFSRVVPFRNYFTFHVCFLCKVERNIQSEITFGIRLVYDCMKLLVLPTFMAQVWYIRMT